MIWVELRLQGVTMARRVQLMNSSWWPGSPSMVGQTGEPTTVVVRLFTTAEGKATPAQGPVVRSNA